jgi:hypothetical protein
VTSGWGENIFEVCKIKFTLKLKNV